MKLTPLLPLAPRPFEDELISSWQCRVASRYCLTVADIDGWLDLNGDVPEEGDLEPNMAKLGKWARACRIRPDVVENLRAAVQN